MSDPVVIFGLVCIAAAITGGGLRALGVELPVIPSLRRQIALAGFGLLLILVSEKDAIINFILDLFSPKLGITESLNAGVGYNKQVPCGHIGSIIFHLDDIVPSTGGNGDNTGVHVRICPPSGGGDCPWGQLAKGQSLKVQCSETGDHNLNVFNFQNNPHVDFKATVTYPR